MTTMALLGHPCVHVFQNVLGSLGALMAVGEDTAGLALCHLPSAAMLAKCTVDLLTLIILRGFQAGRE